MPGPSYPHGTRLSGAPAAGPGRLRTWALAEFQRLCHMATAPPTGGEWRTWTRGSASRSSSIMIAPMMPGRFARRLLREMDSLWVFLAQHGWIQPITGPSARYASGCSGANAPTGQRVRRAIAGWNGFSPSRRRAAPRPNRPMLSSWMLSPICSEDNLRLGCRRQQ